MKKGLKRLGYFLLSVFLVLNIVIAFHAYKFTHFFKKKEEEITKVKQVPRQSVIGTIFFGIDAYKLPIRNTPNHAYKTFTITSLDGIPLEGWYIPCKDAKGTVMLFHGHGGNKAGVLEEADAFYKLGYTTCMIDFRDHGNSEGTSCTIGYKESADVKAAYDYVQSTGEKKIILYGISMGAATIMKSMVDYDIHPDKLILEMPFASLMDAVKSRMKMMGLPEQPFSTLLTFWGGTENGIWAFGNKPSEYAKKIKTPVLLQWGKKDFRVKSFETELIYANLASAQKQLVEYDSSGHESLLHNEHDKWVKSISSFLETK